MVTDFRRVVEALVGEHVDFVIIGGLALVIQGSSRTTNDIDMCYSRDRENLRCLARALALRHPLKFWLFVEIRAGVFMRQHVGEPAFQGPGIAPCRSTFGLGSRP
ncbi:DUF6036 family nucleotidyltransferase [Sorangium sp. So ce1128]